MQRWTACAVILFAALVVSPAPAGAQDDTPETRLEAVRVWQRAELAKLARTAGSKGFASLERRCWHHALRSGHAEAAEKLAALADTPDAPKLSAKQRAGLEKSFDKHGKQAAKRLGAVAAWCAANGHEETARATAGEVIRADPGSADARAALGQKLVKGWGWVGAEEATQFARGLVPLGGDWLKRSAAAKRARRWETAWIVESDHWRIRSNLDLDRVFALRDLLEMLLRRWLADWEGTLDLLEPKGKHDVFVFARESDYWAELEANDARHVKNVPGQYSPTLRRSAFWDVETVRAQGGQTSTLVELMLHECTHQLFRERVKGDHSTLEPGNAPNFWLHEGIAEFYSMHLPVKGRLVLDNKAIRGMVRTAHVRKHIATMPSPSALDAMTRSEFLTSDGERRATHYGTAGFVCLFLDAGRQRSGLRFLVRDVYCRGNPRGRFGELCAPDPEKLDASFRKFMRSF